MRPRTVAILAGITVAAAGLRFWHLGARDVWTDEAISISVARLPWHDFRRVITNREANAAFYELLLRMWIATFGTSEVAVRSLSAIAGTLTVPAIFFAGRRLLGDHVGLVAAALLAVNAFHVRYSQEARGYALVALLVVVATLAFANLREQARARNVAAYVTSSALAIYTHMFAVFVIAAHLLVAACDEPPARKRLFFALASVAVISSPLALFAKTKDVGQIAWIEPASLSGVAEALWKLSGHGDLLLFALFTTAVIVGVALLLVRERSRAHSLLLCGWALLPFVCALVVSLRKPIFLPRYLIVALPALVLVAAATLTRGKTYTALEVVRVVVLTTVIGLSVQATAFYYRLPFDPPPQRWRDLAKTVAAQARPEDLVIFYHPYMRMPFEYSRERAARHGQAPVSFPALADARMMIAPIQQMNRDRVVAAAADLSRVRAVWLIRSSPPDATSDALQAMLSRQFAFVKESNFGAGVDLFVYSREETSSR